jgi:hypothetical protein
MRNAVSLAALVFAVACTGAPPPRSQSSDRLAFEARGSFLVARSGDTLGYSGQLTADGLSALLHADDGTIRTLLVRSTGGELGLGMEFGTWVHERRLDVVVVDYCLSSCANYVFPAGARKRILAGGVVAWHGDAHQQGLAERADSLVGSGVDFESIEDTRAQLDELKAKEDAFFARLSVSECVCRFGNEEVGAPGLNFMSVSDMRRFGITDVLEGPTREADVAPEIRTRGALTFVTIPDDWRSRRSCR